MTKAMSGPLPGVVFRGEICGSPTSWRESKSLMLTKGVADITGDVGVVAGAAVALAGAPFCSAGTSMVVAALSSSCEEGCGVVGMSSRSIIYRLQSIIYTMFHISYIILLHPGGGTYQLLITHRLSQAKRTACAYLISSLATIAMTKMTKAVPPHSVPVHR